MKIYKYELRIADREVVMMPETVKLLTVQNQREVLVVWAAVDERSIIRPRVFYVRGTGHEMGEAEHENYIGSAQFSGGALVFHVFDGGTL